MNPPVAHEVRRALYIGRFQLFHLGHIDVLHTIEDASDVDAIAIAVGSTQYDHRRKSPVGPWVVNPFTCEEREEMIRRSLDGELSKPWSVHTLIDTHDCATWYQSVLERIPPFFCLYSADRCERDLFAAHGKITRGFPRRYSFHGASLRGQMARGDQRYRQNVPAGALLVLDRIGAEERLRQLYARDRLLPVMTEA